MYYGDAIICKDFERQPQVVGSKTGSGLSLCLLTQQPPKTYVAPGEELPP